MKPSAHSPIALALGGGGARGVAHAGVIDGLLEAGHVIERVVGVSSGSLVGAMFAFSPDIAAVERKILGYLLSEAFQKHQLTLFGAGPSAADEETGGVFAWYSQIKNFLHANRVFQRVLRAPSLLPGIILQDVVNNLLPDADIADSKIPLSIVAVDLRSGYKVILEKGPLRDAVRASSALPGIFPPVEFNGMSLCDVGVFDSLPTRVASSYGLPCIVAVDVSSDLKPVLNCETALDVLMRMDEIGESLFRKHVRAAADIVIHPHVAGVEWYDFSSPAHLIQAGRVAARAALPALAKFTRRDQL